MNGIFDDDERVVRGRWHRTMSAVPQNDDALGDDTRCFAHIADAPLQLAVRGAIVPLVLVDACWYGRSGDARLVGSTSYLAPLATRSDEIALVRAPELARIHGRLLPQARWQLKLPVRARSAEELPRPTGYQPPTPPTTLPDGRATTLLDPSRLELMRWWKLSTLTADSLVWLASSEIPVLLQDTFEPAVVADVRVLDATQRPTIASRTVIAGQNRAVCDTLPHFIDQLHSLTYWPHAQELVHAGAR